MSLSAFPASPSEVVRTAVPLGREFYVSPSGSNGNPGNRRNPLQTIGAAVSAAVDGRGDLIVLGPGTYAENVTVAKANLKILGSAQSYVAGNLCRIQGQAGGHALVITAGGVEVSGVKVAAASGQVAIKIDDTNFASGQIPANVYIHDAHVSGIGTTSVGLWCFGAQICRFERLWVQGCVVGVGIAKGSLFIPAFLHFDDVRCDSNGSADFGVLADGGSTSLGSTATSAISLRRSSFLSGGVTKYINFGTTAGSGLIDDVWFKRDVVGGSLAALPAGFVLLGRDVTGFINIVGA